MAASGSADDGLSAHVSDISNSPAFSALDELTAAGKLTVAQAQLYKSKYSKLHEVVLKTYENEKNLLKKAKQLNTDLGAERAKLEKAAARAQEDNEAIATLRAEMSKGESELAMREERELLLQQEVHELASSKTELAADVQTTQRRQAAELQPQIDALEAAVDEARTELGKHKANLAKLTKERDEGAERRSCCGIEERRRDAEDAAQRADGGESEPEKNKKAADVVMSAESRVGGGETVDQLGFLDSELASQSKRKDRGQRMGLAMAVRLRRSHPPARPPPPLALTPARPRRAAGGAPPLGDRAEGARRRRDRRILSWRRRRR